MSIPIKWNSFLKCLYSNRRKHNARARTHYRACRSLWVDRLKILYIGIFFKKYYHVLIAQWAHALAFHTLNAFEYMQVCVCDYECVCVCVVCPQRVYIVDCVHYICTGFIACHVWSESKYQNRNESSTIMCTTRHMNYFETYSTKCLGFFFVFIYFFFFIN